MAGNILDDAKTRKFIAIAISVTIGTFGIGILIGYFSRTVPGSGDVGSNPSPVSQACTNELNRNATSRMYLEQYLLRNQKKNRCPRDVTECMTYDIPRHYIAYHLNEKTIHIDGKLDDDAWNEVPWSDLFVDMRSTVFPAPWLDTKVKVRWDSGRLYLGAYLQETDLYGTRDQHDSDVYNDNDFEFLMDTDGDGLAYKQIITNVLGTMFDYMFNSPSYAAKNASAKSWHPSTQVAIFTDGTVNTPNDIDNYWSVEMAIPFSDLFEGNAISKASPDNDDVWFTQFGRSEQKLEVTAGGDYQVVPNAGTWWSWQEADTVHLRLQKRWGLIQFKTSLSDTSFHFDKWHIYKALFDMSDTLVKYFAVNGLYTEDLRELDAPPYLYTGTCVELPQVTNIYDYDFEVRVKSKLAPFTTGYIKLNGYVHFT